MAIWNMINSDSKKEWVQKDHTRQQPIAKNAPSRQREGLRGTAGAGWELGTLGCLPGSVPWVPAPGCAHTRCAQEAGLGGSQAASDLQLIKRYTAHPESENEERVKLLFSHWNLLSGYLACFFRGNFFKPAWGGIKEEIKLIRDCPFFVSQQDNCLRKWSICYLENKMGIFDVFQWKNWAARGRHSSGTGCRHGEGGQGRGLVPSVPPPFFCCNYDIFKQWAIYNFSSVLNMCLKMHFFFFFPQQDWFMYFKNYRGKDAFLMCWRTETLLLLHGGCSCPDEQWQCLFSSMCISYLSKREQKKMPKVFLLVWPRARCCVPVLSRQVPLALLGAGCPQAPGTAPSTRQCSNCSP